LKAKTYQSRSNRLVNTLESQDTATNVSVLTVRIKEGASDGKEVVAGIFAQNMVKEV
jgi:hypothetical protein